MSGVQETRGRTTSHRNNWTRTWAGPARLPTGFPLLVYTWPGATPGEQGPRPPEPQAQRAPPQNRRGRTRACAQAHAPPAPRASRLFRHRPVRLPWVCAARPRRGPQVEAASVRDPGIPGFTREPCPSHGGVPELGGQPATGGPIGLLQEGRLFAGRRGRRSGLRVAQDLLPAFALLAELPPPVQELPQSHALVL